MRPNSIGSALGLAALAVALTTYDASAQEWPSRPITLVVPFTAGTTSDVLARGLAENLSAALGQPVIIDNRGGAGGNIGAAAVAKAQADGYTLLLATTGPAATNKLMYKSMPFDPQRDFVPIALVGKSPIIIVARPDAPFATLRDMIGHARSNPDKLTAGFPGNGTLGHITGELLQNRAGIVFGHTQYRGSAAIITDLIGGHIDVGMDSMAAYVSNIQEGKLKALAIASGQRWSGLANVPTASESGLAGFEASVWYALLAPVDTPPDIVAKLNAALNAYLRTAQTKMFFDKLGVEAGGGTPRELRSFIAAEIERWEPIVKAAKIAF